MALTTSNDKITSPVRASIKDTSSLRAFLVDQMNLAANGQVDTNRAKAVCNFAQQIYNTLNIELKTAIVMSKMESVDVVPVRFDK